VRSARLLLGCLAALALAAWAGASAPGPTVVLNAKGKGPVTVDVVGLGKEALAGLKEWDKGSERWAEVLAVYVDRPGKGADGQPAVLGSYGVSGRVLRFEPRFPLVKGVRYRVVLNPAKLPGGKGKRRELVLSLPKPAAKPTAVVARVYPTAEKVPENLLKFYLHFSAPMSQGESYTHIKLLDAKGKVVHLPFLELDQELWDPSGTRFTLFFDPGRVKRGLKPREEVGPPLEEGKRYTLVIDKGWADAEGNPLKATFRKTFTVGPPDDKQPDPKKWKLKVPTAGSRAPLRVALGKPLDHALLERLVWVEAGGRRVAGKVEVRERETVWSFSPARAWKPGAYSLVADTRLEDLCGNSIARPFEVDVLRPVEREVKKETSKVPFRVE
jgi:hypothetical protein